MSLNRAGSNVLGDAGATTVMARRRSLMNLGVGTESGKEPPSLPPRPGTNRAPPKDWLTGDDSRHPPVTAGNMQRKTSLGVQRRTSAYYAVPTSYTGRTNNMPSSTRPTASPARGKTPVADSSGDEADGPEDPVSKTVSNNRMSRVGMPNTGVTTTPTGPGGRGGATPRKVGSVYDLVDVAGGVAKSAERRSTRQTSVHDLVDVNPTPTKQSQRQLTGKPRAESPTPLGERSSNSKFMFRTSRTASPLPGANSGGMLDTPSQQRRRPQSMFISPTSSHLNVPDAASAKAASPIVESPSPESPESPRKVRPLRRGSISDIVLRYEAMGGALPSSIVPSAPSTPTTAAGVKPGPPLPIKPIALHARTPSSVTGSGIREKKTSLNMPTRPPSAGGWHSRTCTSPTTDKRLGAEQQIRSPGPPPPPINTKAAQVAPTKRFPTPLNSPVAPQLPVNRRPITPSPPPASEEPESPEKEKPYQGVASLINQWQKKSEASNADPGIKRVWK